MNNRTLEVIAVGLGVMLLLNGGYMLLDPQGWFRAIPGVADTGSYNVHFIRDIGIIYALSGIGLVWGARRRDQRLGLWGVGALWLTGHALFHVWEVGTGIAPASALARDFAGVTLPALVTLFLLFANSRLPDA